MSWYGRGTFKQDLLDSIEHLLVEHGETPIEALESVLEVIGYVTSKFDYESDIYKKAKEDAKREILGKINT